MTTTRLDIDAPSLSYGASHAVSSKHVLEISCFGFRTCRSAIPVRGIERNQVHVRRNIAQLLSQLNRIDLSVVFAVDQGPFEKDVIPHSFGVFAAGAEQLIEWPSASGRHESLALFLRCAMQ